MSVGVVLMTYGAPASLEDVGPYLARVRGGRQPSPELVAEFRERYRRIGGSPLVRITEEQAAALGRMLGREYRVVAAMRYSEPSIRARVAELRPLGPEVVVGVCLSPQWSHALMGGYETALREAVREAVPGARAVMAHAWYAEPAFLDALAERIREALSALDDDVPLLLTAHSLPRRVYESEPEYVAQLRETAELVASRAGLARERWSFAYQSAGHTQEEWLRPDLKEVFPSLAARGARQVLIVPVQFLADHLEVLYDLDIAAAAEARACALEYHRIAMPNTQLAFLRALANVVRHALDQSVVPVSALDLTTL